MKKKELKALLLALGISTMGISLTGCNKEENNLLFNEVLSEVSDNTCLDEILSSEENCELLTDIAIIEECITLSEKLHDLNLIEETKDLKQNPNLEKLSNKDIEKCIIEFESLKDKKDTLSEESKRYYVLAQLLRYNEGAVNDYIYNYGYETIYSVGKIIVKAKLVDAAGLDQSEYKNFYIGENPNKNPNNQPEDLKVTYQDQDTGKEYIMSLNGIGFFNTNSAMISLIESIYDAEGFMLDKDSNKNEYQMEEYNKSRNNELSNMIENVNLATVATNEIEKNKIYQKESNSDVLKLNSKKN